MWLHKALCFQRQIEIICIQTIISLWLIAISQENMFKELKSKRQILLYNQHTVINSVVEHNYAYRNFGLTPLRTILKN